MIAGAPWVAALLFYIFTLLPKSQEKECRLNWTADPAQHQRWLERLRDEQRIAEKQAAGACAEAEAAARQAISATGSVARRSAERAAELAEITMAAAIAANHSARHLGEGKSTKAEEFAARAACAAAEALAAVEAAEAV